MINITPKIIVVRGKNEGKRITTSFDTKREVYLSMGLRNSTKREIHRKEKLSLDTVRIVHNKSNIQFDTVRKINHQKGYSYDTERIVASNQPVYYHSVFVHADGGAPIECVVFMYTDLFPLPDKYVKVQLDNGDYGYLPLAPVGYDFDSGLRYTEDNGTEWQICSTIAFNIIKNYFVDDNYYVNLKNYDFVYIALKNIFGASVSKDTDCIYLTAPHTVCGITKMLMIGLDVRITWVDDGTNDYDNGIVLTTHNNGLCDTSYGGDNKYKANAMLVKFVPKKKYRIQFFDSYGTVSYTKDDLVKSCLLFGKDIEALPEESSTYKRLLDTDSYCTTDKHSEIVHASSKQYANYESIEYLKMMWLEYTNSKMMYDYYDLEKINYKQLEES